MSFHGFQPHTPSNDDLPPSRPSQDDASDSGYGGSVTSDPVGGDSFARNSEQATYSRGSSSLTHHRSPSSKYIVLILNSCVNGNFPFRLLHFNSCFLL